MNLKELITINTLSIKEVELFRKTLGDNFYAKIDKKFHKYKNHYPYYGFIEINVFENNFLMFSNNDDLIAMTFHWFGKSMYEPMSMKIWNNCCKTAKSIYDIGAFSGIYALSAATQNNQAKVYAFEASRRTYARLLMNIQANQLTKNIIAVNKAVSNLQGSVIFHQYRGEHILGNGASMELVTKNQPIVSSEEIVTISLDEFISQGNPIPDLLKIDVEGAEELVLQGMETILLKTKPKMLIEVTPKTANAINNILKSYGYKIYIVKEELMSITQFNGECSCVVNLFAE